MIQWSIKGLLLPWLVLVQRLECWPAKQVVAGLMIHSQFGNVPGLWARSSVGGM